MRRRHRKAYVHVWFADWLPCCGTDARAMPKRITPRLSELKRALRWLKEQYRRRAEEAASGQDRTIERIRKSRVRRPPAHG
jgi:hypothetical protein